MNHTVPGNIKTFVQSPGNTISPRNFNPRETEFPAVLQCEFHARQKMWNFLGHFFIYMYEVQDKIRLTLRTIWTDCRSMSTYPNAHAKVKNLIFVVHFPGNWFSSDIIWNDFLSSTIWVIQIWVSISEFTILKNPGIQPIYNYSYIFSISSGYIDFVSANPNHCTMKNLLLFQPCR